jgi:hypothetical protein
VSPLDDLLGVAVQLAETLERLGLSFAFGGAIAQNYWGTVRATQDVDVLVALPRIRFEELAAALRAEGYLMRDKAGKDVEVLVPSMVAQEGDRHLFVVYRDLVKVEVFLPFLPLQQSLLRRAVTLPLGDRQVPITTAEDLIVLKMAFHREKDLRDIRGILWAQRGSLDLAYVREWADRTLAADIVKELEGWIAKYAGGPESPPKGFPR